ncbi:phage tail tape measure protein [Ancylobacter aquaticus]|nr:phage tail tape measure protein [Ancylobacter aquaticus]
MAGTDLETLVVTLSANIKTYENSMNRAAGIMNRQARELERRGAQLQKRFDGIGKGIANNLTAPLAGIGAALGVREIAAYADVWTLAGNKIKAAAASSNVQVRSLDQLKDGANAARADLESYVDLYAKLIRNASGVAKSEQEIAAATEVVAKAFKVGGASANEQAAGILQLGQALGSGVLQGDELRSLRENAPVIAKAIATEMGVSIAALKELGAQGKITSDIVFRALINAQREVAKQFNTTNATIKDGITTVNNEFLAYIGNADGSTGASRALVGALLALSTNFGTVADSVVILSTVIIGALTGRALAGMIVSLGTALQALGALITALRTGAAVGVAFTASLGPIGLLVGAAAAAILLLSLRQETADEAAVQHKKAITDLTDAFALAKGGAESAKAKFAELSKTHLDGAKAAVENAEAQLLAAQAVRQAAQDTPMFGEGGSTGASQESFAGQQVADALAVIAKRKAELIELQNKLANPETGLTPTTEGYGTGTNAPPSATKVGRRDAGDRFREDLQAVKDRTAALAAEQQMIGQGIAVQESRRVQIDLEAAALADLREEARRKGETDLASIQLAPEQIAAIKEVSDAYGQQAEALARAQQAFGDMNDLGHDALGGFISDIRQGVSATEALSNALDRVIDKLLDMALNSVFDQNGGILSSLLGGMSTGGSVSGSGGIGHAATGGRIRGPGSGTSDSVPMMLSNGEYVVRASQAKKHAALLEAINSGKVGMMAAGGFVAPTLPRMPARSGGVPAGGSGGMPAVNVSVQTLPGQTADVRQSRGADGSVNIEAMVRKIAQSEVLNQLSDGSQGARVLKRQWGLRRSDLA